MEQYNELVRRFDFNSFFRDIVFIMDVEDIIIQHESFMSSTCREERINLEKFKTIRFNRYKKDIQKMKNKHLLSLLNEFFKKQAIPNEY